MGLLIDSTILIQIERDRRAPTEVMERAGEEDMAISAITASELLHGVYRADSEVRRSRREAFVADIIEELPVLPFDLTVAAVHARLSSDLERSGSIIGPHDLIVAATALSHGLSVVTLNVGEFERVEGLRVIRW